jgi:hypothetical protein
MGEGAFGSNGSVHWEIKYGKSSAPPDHRDYDVNKKHPGDKRKDVPKTWMKRRPMGNGKGAFLVTARFKTRGDAEAALAKALRNYKNGALTLAVPLRPFRAKAGSSKAWEVKVRW